MINFKEDEKLSVLNHSCAHLLAQAVKHLYPQARFWAQGGGLEWRAFSRSM
ncbi:MAG: hypothetical protein IJL95_08540 [Solobacterium sp.]|nr:hypothetical protein [Solobacterium sp.]